MLNQTFKQLALSVSLLLALPAVMQAQFTFTTNNGAITITGYTGNPTSLNIPGSTNGYPVTSIGNYAFNSKSSLTDVTIPNGITNIGQGAFNSCRGLRGVSIPNSVLRIEDFAFYYCSGLTNIVIGTGVITIGQETFASCTNLTQVAIPNSVASVGYDAFSSCHSLTNVTIGSSVTNIGEEVFFDCYRLPAITVAASNPAYSSVNGVLFDKAQKVLIECPGGLAGAYTISNGVTSISDGAFASCFSLTGITIGTNITSIGFDVFDSCTNLAKATIPNSITNIGDAAFFSCSGLTNVTFGTNLTDIGNETFESCSSLVNLALPNSVINIGGNAFAGCSSLTNATIGSSTTNLGVGVFDSCSSLKTITVVADNPAYGSVAGALFDKAQKTLIECPGGLAGSYTISNNVTSVMDGAFNNCASLTNVIIGSGVTNIGVNPFFDCASLKAITVTINNLAYSSKAGVLFDKIQTTLIRYPEDMAGSYAIPGSVTSIGAGAFTSCFGLTDVTIPNGVTSIGSEAFRFCTSLTNVTIGSSVSSIGDGAFTDCFSLIAVCFAGNAPTTVGDYVFVIDTFSGPPCCIPVGPEVIYYLPGTTGWGTLFADSPTALWYLPNPVILGDVSFGANQFSFTISWATNIAVVVEACTNLFHPAWKPVQTNTLTGGTSYFSDSQWTNYPGRLYRLRSP